MLVPGCKCTEQQAPGVDTRVVAVVRSVQLFESVLLSLDGYVS